MIGRTNNYFPSQVVSDSEKISYEYGLKIAKAIEQEWFSDGRGSNRHNQNRANFHNLRLYARGEQSIQKYKDELSINGDLSYLNLDWKPVPIISKFVDIVVNGMAERLYDIKAYSQDAAGVSKRTAYMEDILKDMKLKEFDASTKASMNIDLASTPKEKLPDSEEELELHMQLDYKQAVEIAEEQAIRTLMEGSRYELIKKRFFYDLAVIGIGATKTTFNNSEGAKVEYVDPANLVYSHTDSPYFEDLYYVGEVKKIPINELIKEFPFLEQSDLEEIQQKNNNSNRSNRSYQDNDDNKIEVKNGKNGQKILYKMDNVYLLGIPLKIDGFTIIKQTNKHLIINIEETKQYQLLKDIDSHFASEYQLPYGGFIKNNLLRINKNRIVNYTNSSKLYLSIHNIKMKNSFITVQLFTI